MTTITVRRNEIGHGHDVENSGVYSVRRRLPEINLFHEFIPNDEPELQLISIVEGVSRVAVYTGTIGCAYDLCIKKGSAFSWEEIDSQIIPLLEAREKRLA